MTSKQEAFRERVVSFYLKHADKGTVYTAKHFESEGRSDRTIRSIISNYLRTGTTKRMSGSGSQLKIFSKKRIQQLYRDLNHSDKFNISSAARKYRCGRPTIRYWLKKRSIKLYKKKKSEIHRSSKRNGSKTVWLAIQESKMKKHDFAKNKNPTNVPQCRPIEDFSDIDSISI